MTALLLAAMLGTAVILSGCGAKIDPDYTKAADAPTDTATIQAIATGSELVHTRTIINPDAKFVRVTRNRDGFRATVYASHKDRASATAPLGHKDAYFADTVMALTIPGQLRFNIEAITARDLPFDFDVVTFADIIYALFVVQNDTVDSEKWDMPDTASWDTVWYGEATTTRRQVDTGVTWTRATTGTPNRILYEGRGSIALPSGPEDTTLTRHFDGCNWNTCDAWNRCTSTLAYCPPERFEHGTPSAAEADPDTTHYWLSRRIENYGGWCPGACDKGSCTTAYCEPVEVVDTVYVMRKR